MKPKPIPDTTPPPIHEHALQQPEDDGKGYSVEHYIQQIHETADKLLQDHANRGDVKLLSVALRELPPRGREVFELSRVHGLKYAEIAEALAISQKTVEAQMGKALRILRERLATWL